MRTRSDGDCKLWSPHQSLRYRSPSAVAARVDGPTKETVALWKGAFETWPQRRVKRLSGSELLAPEFQSGRLSNHGNQCRPGGPIASCSGAQQSLGTLGVLAMKLSLCDELVARKRPCFRAAIVCLGLDSDDLIFASTTGLVLKVARRDLAQVLLRHLGCQSRFSQHPQAWAAHWEVLWTPVALTNTVQPCASPLAMKLHASPEIWVRQWITRCEAMRKCGVHSVSLLLAPIRR